MDGWTDRGMDLFLKLEPAQTRKRNYNSYAKTFLNGKKKEEENSEKET